MVDRTRGAWLGTLLVVLLGAVVRLSCGTLIGRYKPRAPHYLYAHPDGEPRHLAPEWMPLSSPVVRAAPVVDGRQLVPWDYQRQGGEIPKVPWITIASTALLPGEDRAAILGDLERALRWTRALVEGFPFELDASACETRKRHVRCRATGAQADGATQHLALDLRASKTHAFVTLWRGPAPPDERELDHLLDRLDL